MTGTSGDETTLAGSLDPATSVPEAPRAAEGLRRRVSEYESGLGPVQYAGRFELRRWIADGGMGGVYEGRDADLDRKVAIKVLHRVSHEEGIDDLRREARALARVGDPNVVIVHEVGTLESGGLFVAMEFVEGTTLREAVRRWRDGGRRSTSCLGCSPRPAAVCSPRTGSGWCTATSSRRTS
ncbi:MAG: protein kinase [Myxococcota bacterium]